MKYVRMLLYLVALLVVNAWAHPVIIANPAPLLDTGTVESRAASPEPAALSRDDHQPQRWAIERIEAVPAREAAETKRPVTAAILDTGVAGDDPELDDMIVARVNFTADPSTDDLYGHGTHMAGTVAAVAPDCRLMNIKVADDDGRCESSVVARGITSAVYHGADIVNVSLCTQGSPELEEAVDYAWANGAVVIAAAGNTGTSNPSYPACYENCIAVAGTDEHDRLAALSNHGDWVDVAAPGARIYGQLPGGEYGYKSGTSSATAHVSGIAALVFSVAQDRNGNCRINDEVRQAIEEGCAPIGVDGTGCGLVNALKAVSCFLSDS